MEIYYAPSYQPDLISSHSQAPTEPGNEYLLYSRAHDDIIVFSRREKNNDVIMRSCYSKESSS